MKFFFLFNFFICWFCGFSQSGKEEVGVPKYDTTQGNEYFYMIHSENYFPFCSGIYKVSRQCDMEQGNSSCCIFEAQVPFDEKIQGHAYLNCYDGTIMMWRYFEKEEEAEFDWVDSRRQYAEQNKSYNQTPCKILLLDKEVTAVNILSESHNGYIGHEIMAYGIINGQSLVVRFMTNKELKNNDDIPPTLRPFFKFK